MSLDPLVLTYHGLGDYSRARDPHNLMVPPERFLEQVRHVQSRGYRFLTMAELGRRMHAGEPLVGVGAITFDDGSLDNLELVPGLLEELDVPATVFVCPGLLGNEHPFLAPGSGSRLMDRDELLELAKLPRFEIGSHTITHADLSNASLEVAYEELSRSRSELERLLQRPVLSFAYPKGIYSASCPEAAERAGYLTAVTCGLGATSLPYELPRVCVSTLDGKMTFELKTRGFYDGIWASPPGRLARRVARPFRHGRFAHSAGNL